MSNTNDQNKNIKHKGSKPQKTENTQTEFICKRCATTHGPRSCPAYSKESNHRIGHLKVCCRTLRVHMLSENESETGCEIHFSIDNLTTDKVNR